MSRKNHRRSISRPLDRALLKATPLLATPSTLSTPTPLSTPAPLTAATLLHTEAASFPAPNTQHQETPFFEQNPKGGLRVVLTGDCWCEPVNIPSHKLLSDPSYQRDIKDGHVQEILDEWDSRVMNFPKVSLREDGNYYIFDGAHTKTATDKKNSGREHMVPCILYHNLKLEDEAYLFAVQNSCSREVAFGYKLKARITGGDKQAIGFRNCNSLLGAKIVKEGRSTKYVISAVNTAYRLYETWGEKRYTEVIGLILDTWNGDANSLSQVMIEGVSRFYRAYGEVFDRNRFVRDLSPVDVRSLADKSRSSMRDTAQTMARLLVQHYNRKGGKHCVQPDWLMVLGTLRKDEQLPPMAKSMN